MSIVGWAHGGLLEETSYLSRIARTASVKGRAFLWLRRVILTLSVMDLTSGKHCCGRDIQQRRWQDDLKTRGNSCHAAINVDRARLSRPQCRQIGF
jgi:hypothetical protein